MMRLRLWVLGRKTRDVKCHFHHLVSGVPTINTTYGCGCVDHPGRLVFIRFLCEITVPHHFHTVLFVQPTLKGVAIHVVKGVAIHIVPP